ncbi:MAG TPA: efflux transporter outer membrane subunit [Methylomirabilota bacterium]|nr:efflux transporter outer membrane subunit [Methylomirabilota bacterium]
MKRPHDLSPALLSRARILCVLLAALLAGCARSPDRHAFPPAGTPAAWSTPAASAEVPTRDWWTTLDSAELNAFIDEALAVNPDLEAAVARLDAAIAQAAIAGADLSPGVGLGFDSQRRQQNFVGFPIPGQGDEVLTTRSTSHAVSFNVSWELDLWGRVRAGQRAALAEVQASAADFNGARLSLAAQTAKAWIALTETRRQLELARSTVDNHRQTAGQVRDRYERGLRSPLDLRLAQASLHDAEALAALRGAELDAAKRGLEVLLGRYPSGTLQAIAELPDIPVSVPAGLPAQLLERRPDLIVAERRLAASHSRVQEAKAALLPRISLTASGGRSSSELDDLLSSQFNVWSLAGNLAQPLLEGGRLQANVDLSEARGREALAAYASTVLRAFSEVETALAAESHLEQREQDLLHSVEQSRAALVLAEDRYRLGLEEMVTLLESQRRLLNAESQWIAVRRQRLENRVDLHLALGGGFSIEPDAARVSKNPVPLPLN